MKQGKAQRDVKEGGHREPRPYAINQNYPSQIGTAVDPLAAEKMSGGQAFAPHLGPTDGMAAGPGANRTVKTHGSQGEH